MRIAAISNLYPPRVIGGYELACDDVLGHLARRGHEVRVLTSRYGLADATRDDRVWRVLDFESGMTTNPTPPTWQRLRGRWFTPRNLVAAREFVHDFQPDVVYVWNLLFAAPLAVLMGATLAHRPMVAHLMDYWLPQTYNLKPAPYIRRGRYLKQTFGRLIDRYVRFTALIAMSETLKREHVNAGFAPDRLTIVRHGIDLSRIPNPPDRLDRPDTRFLCAGQVIRGKGVHVVIEAMAILRANPTLPPFRLDVIGTGPPDYRAELDSLVRRHGLGEHVAFRGYVERSDLLRRYGEHDVFVFPTHALEPGGIVVMEAMASGLAVITSNAGGQSEVINDGVNGLLVEPTPVSVAEAMRRLIVDRDVLAHVRMNARATALERFSIERSVDEVEAVLARAADQARPLARYRS